MLRIFVSVLVSAVIWASAAANAGDAVSSSASPPTAASATLPSEMTDAPSLMRSLRIARTVLRWAGRISFLARYSADIVRKLDELERLLASGPRLDEAERQIREVLGKLQEMEGRMAAQATTPPELARMQGVVRDLQQRLSRVSGRMKPTCGEFMHRKDNGCVDKRY